MSEITAVTPQVKDKNRVNIYIDGEFVCGLQLETAVKYRLKAGVDITREKLNEIEFESEKTKALEKAADYVSRGVKSEKQVTDYLKGKGYGETVVGYVKEKLKEYGYIDDTEFAAEYIRSVGGKKGEKLIRRELKMKGIAAEAVDSAYLQTGHDEQAVFTVADKFMRRREPSRENIAKLYRHLIGKGFSFEEAGKAADKYKED